MLKYSQAWLPFRFVDRKHELQSGGRKAPLRSWKNFYGILCGQLLCFFKVIFIQFSTDHHIKVKKELRQKKEHILDILSCFNNIDLMSYHDSLLFYIHDWEEREE